MRVCILTSNKIRHRYMANRIAKECNVVGVFSEGKQPKRHLAEKAKQSGDPDELAYFEAFQAKEREYLLPTGEDFDLPDNTPLIQVTPDKLNEDELYQQITDLKPDCFAVFGTSLVKRRLLDLTPNFINIHLGLSPYYRGVACSFWPFYNNEPQYVGVTVFFLDEGIDSGPIIHQGLVDLEPGDTVHDASVKAITVGVDLQIKALKELADGSIKSHPQDMSIGKVYYNKDFNADLIREFNQRWPADAYAAYLDVQAEKKGNVDYIP